MMSRVERKWSLSDVAGAGRHGQPVRIQLVGDGELEGKWIPGLRMDGGRQLDAVGGLLHLAPGHEGCQAVDGVVLADLRDRQLELLAPKSVAPVCDPVWPGHERHPATP